MIPCRLRRGLARALAFVDFLEALRARDLGRAVVEASRVRGGGESR
jgi:hypothetical protein